jgi:hypothetical protein
VSKPISGPSTNVHGPARTHQAPAPSTTTTTTDSKPANEHRCGTHLEDGTWADAQVTLSGATAEAGESHGRGHGHGKRSASSDGEFKNHGQMVSAAAHAGIHGKDLAAIAKGDTTVDKAALSAIGNGDVTLAQYQAAQKQVADGGLTQAQLSTALKLVAEKDITLEAAIAEAKKPTVPAATTTTPAIPAV